MDVITGVAYTPFFLLPSISILPMDPSGGQTGLFWTLHLKDLSMNDLSAVWCKSILYGILWLNLFSIIWTRNISSGRCDQSVESFSREKWCSIIWTALHWDKNSFCKCFDLPGYYSGYGLCEFWTQMPFHCLACKSCQPQQPSRPTIPLEFSPIWLRDTERSAFALPIFSMVRESCKPRQPVGWTFKDELRSTLA